MNKEQRIEFILNHQEGIDEKMIERCIELVNKESEKWDYSLFKELFFNPSYINNIVILSINHDSFKEEFYVNYYSYNTNLFCFSSKTNSNYLYKILLREKNINTILND